jgi:predicted kinase
MRNWMRDRIMRRKKKDGDAEKASSEQPKQTPLQPDFYEAQAPSDSIGNSVEDNIGNNVHSDDVRDAAPARPVVPALPPIDDDNRWNRIDADLLPAPRAATPRSFERPARRQAPSRSAGSRPPRVVAAPEAPEPIADRPTPSAEGREAGPGRGRRRRGRRGRGRSKPEVSMAPAVQAPLRPSSMSDPSTFEASADPVVAPRPAARAVSTDPAAPKKYKGVVVLSIGLPGSGKSSWFKRNNITPLSSDLLRGLLFDDPNEQRFQDLVFSNLRSLLRARLVARRPMNYVDATNLSPHERQGWIKLAHDYGYEVQAVYFDVPLEVCLDRNRKRQRVVAEDVMRRMSTKLQPPTFEEGFTKITNVRVKKKEGDDAPATEAAAEVLDLSASDALASDGSEHSHAPETPEEIGVATETVE